MFSISKFLPIAKWIIIISFVSMIVYWIYDYSQSKERLEHMINENKEINEQITSIRDVVDKQTKLVTVLRSEYRKIDIRYTEKVEELSSLRKLTSQYIKDNSPVLTQELNSKFNDIQLKISCSSGDILKCQK